MKNNVTGACRADLRTVTLSQRAQKILAASAIPSEVIRLEGTSGHGCSYGIELSCNQRANAEHILSASGIGIKQWNKVD